LIAYQTLVIAGAGRFPAAGRKFTQNASPLALLVLGVPANDPNLAEATDDLAFHAHFLH
jgi:hypothetical protein